MKIIKTSEFLRFKNMEKQLVFLSGSLEELAGKYKLLKESYDKVCSANYDLMDEISNLKQKLSTCYARIGGFTKGRNKRNARGSK